MLVLVINHQPHRTRTDLRRKLVRCLACHRSTFSRVGTSDKPGAVQRVTGPTAHPPVCQLAAQPILGGLHHHCCRI
jgi:hypothetical protein